VSSENRGVVGSGSIPNLATQRQWESATNVTVAGNTVGAGGPAPGAGTGTTAIPGIAGNPGSAPGIQSANLQASIVASNGTTAGCAAVVDKGGNLSFPNATCPGAVLNPQLGPLADNGGPTRTRALGAGSGAIDLTLAGLCAATDQRGVARPKGAACDAGAYEVAPPTVTTGVASGLKTTLATLGGSVVPNARATTYHFEFGATTAYGSSTAETEAGAGLGPGAASAALAHLKPGTTVHFRLVGTNGDGTSFGADSAFTLPKFKIKIVGKKAKVDDKGKATVKVNCPANALTECSGSIVLKAKAGKGAKKSAKGGGKSLGKKAKFKIKAGKTKTLKVKLSATGQAMVRDAGGAGLSATATANASDRDRNKAKATKKLKLKAG
jgi:hypothetical protein